MEQGLVLNQLITSLTAQLEEFDQFVLTGAGSDEQKCQLLEGIIELVSSVTMSTIQTVESLEANQLDFAYRIVTILDTAHIIILQFFPGEFIERRSAAAAIVSASRELGVDMVRQINPEIADG